MESIKLFFSWQSDVDGKIGRRFIEQALTEACLLVSAEIGRGIEIDSDTRNVPGTPPINETILAKIRDCDIFCGDMTFVARTDRDKLVPNPNVMGEYGYALHAVGSSRILLAMNTAFGSPDQLPFDLHHLRHPITYEAPLGIADGERRQRRARFVERLAEALRVIIAHFPAGGRGGDIPEIAIAGAIEALDGTLQRIVRSDVPALVPNPRLVIGVAPISPDWSGRLDPRAVTEAMNDLIPDGFSRTEEGGDAQSWWLCDPPVRRNPQLNPEARWYVRFSRQGVFDAALEVAQRIGDDPDIVISGHRLEAMLVDLVDRASAMLAKIGFGPVGLLDVQLLGCEELIVTAGREPARRMTVPFIGLGRQRIDRIGAPLGDDIQQMLDGLWMAAGHRYGSPSFDLGRWAGYDGGALYRI